MPESPFQPQIKRGDLVAFPTRTSYVSLSGPGGSSTVWEIGFVTSVARDGQIKRIDTGRGQFVKGQPVGVVGCRGEQIDAAKARAWLESGDRWPSKPNTTPLRTLDEVRALVSTWRTV